MKTITKPYINSKSGILGVCRTAPKRGSAYWQANAPGGPSGDDPYWCRRYYVKGMGEESARSLAWGFRSAWEQARRLGTLGDFWQRFGTERYIHGGER